jgi:hypothetical protein
MLPSCRFTWPKFWIHSELTGTMRGDAGIERHLSVSAAPSLETFPATSRPSTNLLGLIGR